MDSTKGTARSLTDLFKAARYDHKRNPSLQSSSSDTGRQIFLEGVQRSDQPGAAEVSLPPAWVDIFESSAELVPQMRERMEKLHKAEQERLKLSFGDVEGKDREIASITGQITNLMRECEGAIKRISGGADPQDKVRHGAQSYLAMHLQESTRELRTRQKNYIDKLKRLYGSSQQQIEEEKEQEEAFDDMEEVARERNQVINQIVNNVNELAMVFKEISTLVVEQGTMLDRIDYNLQMAAENTRMGLHQLQKTEARQAGARAVGCILTLLLLISAMVLALIAKYS